MGLRKKSLSESKKVKNFKKTKYFIKIINNKKKIINNIQHNARKVRYSLLTKNVKKEN